MAEVISRLRQPEYTGENRCVPCTVVNVGLSVALAALVGLVLTPVAGAFALLAALLAVYLRGYLVPGTPEFTKRYLPPSVLALFGKETFAERRIDVDPDAPKDELLLAAGALETGEEGEDASITRPFADAWAARLRETRGREPTEADIGDALGAEEVSKHGEAAAVIDGRKSKRWLSTPALRADLAAAAELETRLGPWSDLDPTERLDVLRGLRLFLGWCPECEAALESEEYVAEHCCERPHTVVELVCPACEVPIAEAAVVGTDERPATRLRALRSRSM
jgi:hypothetical protein